MRDDGVLDLDNQFCFALYAASRQVVRAYTEALKALDLTYPQYLVMLVLWEWSRDRYERPTVKALGQRLDLDSGTLTPLLRRLQAKGVIARQRISPDEREVFLRITPAGARLKRRARRVPLDMLQQSPVSLPQVIRLRDQLKLFRAEAVA
jgi:MarR family transcriptional regulator, organic hydroperoxide resistance regulator